MRSQLAYAFALLFLSGCLRASAQKETIFDSLTTPTISDVQRKNLEELANDLPQLGHYRDGNAQLAAPHPAKPRVVFFGDSLTEAWGLTSNGSSFFPGKGYLNRGISGQTTLQMLIRFRQDVIDLHPSVVLVLAGTNDFAGNTGPASPLMVADNIRSMAELARANQIRFVICSLLPSDGYPWRPDARPAEPIRTLNAWLKDFAHRFGFIYVDYYDALATPEGAMRSEFTHDGVHLNADGYAQMSPLAEAGIAAALKRRP
jgi:acyl-CoA thioesterase-1